uniref:Unannotated protein n=1 Tax=freshwater metagenome TaxID=449393 RepID=A0A6J7MW47_9ZZZZ
MHPDEDRISRHVAHGVGDVGLTVKHALVGVTLELAPLGWHPRGRHALHQSLVTTAVADEVGNGDEVQPVLIGETAEIVCTRHPTVVEHDLAQHAGGPASGHAGEVNRCLGVTRTLQHPTGPCPQREDVARAVEFGRTAGRVGQRTQGAGTISRRDARRRALTEVHAHRERSTKGLVVVARHDHLGKVELGATLGSETDTDHARGVAHEESNRLGCREVRGHDEVALVLPVLVVGHDHDLAATDRSHCVLNGIETNAHC